MSAMVFIQGLNLAKAEQIAAFHKLMVDTLSKIRRGNKNIT